MLAGGASSRMGKDKALLPYRGAALVEYVAGEVRRACGSVWLVAAEDRYSHLGIPCLPERYAGFGPMSGIEAALRVGGFEWSLIVACDMPGITAEVLQPLVTATQGAVCDAVVAAAPGGQLEPLCAVYHAGTLPRFASALAAGDYAVHKLLKELDIIRVDGGSEAPFRNANTAQEWAAWSR